MYKISVVGITALSVHPLKNKLEAFLNTRLAAPLFWMFSFQFDALEEILFGSQTLAPGRPSSPGNPMAPGSPCSSQQQIMAILS